MRFLFCVLFAATIALPALAQDKDTFGNIYPPECSDLSDVRIPVIEVDGAWLDKAAGGETAGINGLWSRTHVIYIKKGLNAERRADIIRHELCHEKMWRLTGDPRWH